jgi:hypothetical protein
MADNEDPLNNTEKAKVDPVVPEEAKVDPVVPEEAKVDPVTGVPVTDTTVDPVTETKVDPVTETKVDPVTEAKVDTPVVTEEAKVTKTVEPVAIPVAIPVATPVATPVPLQDLPPSSPSQADYDKELARQQPGPGPSPSPVTETNDEKDFTKPLNEIWKQIQNYLCLLLELLEEKDPNRADPIIISAIQNITILEIACIKGVISLPDIKKYIKVVKVIEDEKDIIDTLLILNISMITKFINLYQEIVQKTPDSAAGIMSTKLISIQTILKTLLDNVPSLKTAQEKVQSNNTDKIDYAETFFLLYAGTILVGGRRRKTRGKKLKNPKKTKRRSKGKKLKKQKKTKRRSKGKISRRRN